MKDIITLLFLLICSISCGQTSRSSHDYKCAKQLTDAQIADAQKNSFEDYSDEDLDLLADITTFVNDSNPEKNGYECFFIRRQKDLLFLHVLGLEDEAKIEKTFCTLLENKNIKLPKKIIILFHRYVNGFEDGGVIVGLSN